jgi:hypothetical protein
MTFNWHIYDIDFNFVEEVYMTEDEFRTYVSTHPTAYSYKKYEAGENWQ